MVSLRNLWCTKNIYVFAYLNTSKEYISGQKRIQYVLYEFRVNDHNWEIEIRVGRDKENTEWVKFVKF